MPIIKERQSITDMAVQYAGDAAMAPVIAKANNVSVTSDVEAGTFMIIPAVSNKEVANFFERNGYAPAMKINTSTRPGGIGYMQIGTDFKVS